MNIDVSPRSVVLVGLPGAGKSTIGRQLSNAIACRFVDTDTLIERRLGCGIRHFFEREGEEKFRDIESSVLEEVLRRPGTSVIATGGGVVKRASNRALIAASAITVYLHAKPRDLATRLRHDVRRPLLNGGDRLEKIEALFQERHVLYCEMAQVQVDAIGRPLPILLQDIVESLDRCVAVASTAAASNGQDPE